MQKSARTLGFVLSAPVLFLALRPAVRADDTPTTADLVNQIKSLQSQVSDLQAKENQNWLTQERANQIKAIVQDVLADSKTHTQFEDGASYGYNNGFYIQTPDKNFKLQLNGYMQFRYTFTDSTVKHEGFTTTPKSGDASGFDFRYARLTFSGNVFTPNLTYLVTGDFAGNSTNANDFQVVDAYMAYRFNDLLNVRAGAFLAPFSRLEYISSGLDFVDFPSLLNPFDPARVFGVSLYGDIIKDKLLYELNVNNGPQSNHNGRAAELGGFTDNRPSFYARTQYFGGSGKPSDFADEADLRKDNRNVAWLVEGAFGYDSANTSATAFPGKQASESIPGVGSLTGPGFVTFPLNGDVFRGTIDGELKYMGWDFIAAGFVQQINENPGVGITSPNGSTAASIPAGFFPNHMNFLQASYYGQIGYMITPQWEVVARAGQLLTEGSSNTMEEYSAGVNYYIYGKNFKIQADMTYIPNAAAISNTTFGSFVNTQDIIGRIQLQLKF